MHQRIHDGMYGNILQGVQYKTQLLGLNIFYHFPEILNSYLLIKKKKN